MQPRLASNSRSCLLFPSAGIAGPTHRTLQILLLNIPCHFHKVTTYKRPGTKEVEYTIRETRAKHLGELAKPAFSLPKFGSMSTIPHRAGSVAMESKPACRCRDDPGTQQMATHWLFNKLTEKELARQHTRLPETGTVSSCLLCLPWYHLRDTQHTLKGTDLVRGDCGLDLRRPKK